MEKRIFLIALVFLAHSVQADISDINYKTFFGTCPSKSAGSLTISLIKEFEMSNSLRGVKQLIITERLTEKFFLSDYRIKYNPVNRTLIFNYECPDVLMKVQTFRDDGQEHYTAILGDNGELLDPTYEVLLRSEKKLKGDIPLLVMPVSAIDHDEYKQLVKVLLSTDRKMIGQFSEVIVGASLDLTVIMSIKGKAVSAFMGRGNLSEKMTKLTDIVEYFGLKKNMPTVVNLTNAKKVVVKFSENI